MHLVERMDSVLIPFHLEDKLVRQRYHDTPPSPELVFLPQVYMAHRDPAEIQLYYPAQGSTVDHIP